jgi:hypothetical protein
MSCNRENVIWKSRDGTWGRGFYDYWQTGEDHEWDVEYDYSRFNFASVGHPSEEAAHASWHGANPGGSTIYEEPCAETDEFDQLADKYLAEQRERRSTLRRF